MSETRTLKLFVAITPGAYVVFLSLNFPCIVLLFESCRESLVFSEPLTDVMIGAHMAVLGQCRMASSNVGILDIVIRTQSGEVGSGHP